MKLIQGMKLFYNNVQKDLVTTRFLHITSLMMDQKQFCEKPAWFKKFKVKQAQMQKDDGLPVFLKKGSSDKLLYNITLGILFIGLISAAKSMEYLDKL